jgi:hypothetical protein
MLMQAELRKLNEIKAESEAVKKEAEVESRKLQELRAENERVKRDA